MLLYFQSFYCLLDGITTNPEITTILAGSNGFRLEHGNGSILFPGRNAFFPVPVTGITNLAETAEFHKSKALNGRLQMETAFHASNLFQGPYGPGVSQSRLDLIQSGNFTAKEEKLFQENPPATDIIGKVHGRFVFISGYINGNNDISSQ